MGSITVQLTSWLFCLELAALLKLNEQQFYLFCQIQTIPIGGQPQSDTSPSVSVLCLLSSTGGRQRKQMRRQSTNNNTIKKTIRRMLVDGAWWKVIEKIQSKFVYENKS